MDWYYAVKGSQLGPVGDEEFRSLVQNGTITGETLVWRAGMANWARYSTIAAPAAPAAPPMAAAAAADPFGAAPAPDMGGGARPGYVQSAVAHQTCVECGRSFPWNEMVKYQDKFVCPNCKPIFFQRIREGVPIAGAMRYAGFWIRFVAFIIDYIALSIINGVFGFFMGLVMGPAMSGGNPSGAQLAFLAFFYLIAFGVGAAYWTYFPGKYGGTPGKLALGLRIVTSDGQPITYLRAFARMFAYIVSAIILYIGFIMAGFDSEKRALHDIICDTRVIYKNG